jgi:hypothetical protein
VAPTRKKVKGRFVVQYEDREQVIYAGDSYYLAPGHACRFVEDTEVVEFSLEGEYQRPMEAAARNVAALQASERPLGLSIAGHASSRRRRS